MSNQHSFYMGSSHEDQEEGYDQFIDSIQCYELIDFLVQDKLARPEISSRAPKLCENYKYPSPIFDASASLRVRIHPFQCLLHNVV